MDIVEQYNADAERLEKALSEMESEFAWAVRWYGPGLAFDTGLWDRDPTADDLELLHIRATTKARYDGRRAAAVNYLSRELIESDALPMVCEMLERNARAEVEELVQEWALQLTSA